MRCAPDKCGGLVYKASISESKTRRSASTSCVTSAARRSLSPNRISWVATVSFSLTIGKSRRGEEPTQPRTGITTVSGVVGGPSGERPLPRRYPVPIKRNLIPHDESRLSHGCRGLLCCKVGGSLIQLQIRQPCRDGTRGHKNDLRTSPVRTGKGVDEKVNVGGVDASDGG